MYSTSETVETVSQDELQTLSELRRSQPWHDRLRIRLTDLVLGGADVEPGQFTVTVYEDAQQRWSAKVIKPLLGDKETRRVKALLPSHAITHLVLPTEELWSCEIDCIEEINRISQKNLVWYLRLVDKCRRATELHADLAARVASGAFIEPGAWTPKLRTTHRIDWSPEAMTAVIGADRVTWLTTAIQPTIWRRLMVLDTLLQEFVGWHTGQPWTADVGAPGLAGQTASEPPGRAGACQPAPAQRIHTLKELPPRRLADCGDGPRRSAGIV